MHTRAGGPVPAISLSTELPEIALEALKVTPQPAASPQRRAARSTTKRTVSAAQQAIQDMEGETSLGLASPRAEAVMAPEGDATSVVAKENEPFQEVEGGSSPAGSPAANLREALPLSQEASDGEQGRFQLQNAVMQHHLSDHVDCPMFSE